MPPQMRFDEPQYATRRRVGPGGVTGLILRWGFAKDEPGAVRVLLYATGGIVLLAVAIFIFATSGPKPISTEDYLQRAQHSQYVPQ